MHDLTTERACSPVVQCLTTLVSFWLLLLDEKRLACLLSTPHSMVWFGFSLQTTPFWKGKKKKSIGGMKVGACVCVCEEGKSLLELWRRDSLTFLFLVGSCD